MPKPCPEFCGGLNSAWRDPGEEGAVCAPICGRLSKWVCAGVEMLERDDIKDDIISGDAGGIDGGALVDVRCRGTLVDRPWKDLRRRLEVLASCAPALRGISCDTAFSFGAIVRLVTDQSIGYGPAELNRRTQRNSISRWREKKNHVEPGGCLVILRVSCW